MDPKRVLEQALHLSPEERAFIAEELLRSLDKSDPRLDAIWAEEAEKRLHAYRNGKLKGVEAFPTFKVPADARPFSLEDVQNAEDDG